LESAINIHVVHTIFARWEYVEKDDLTPAVASNSPLFLGRIVDFHPFLPQGQTGPLTLEIFGVKQFTLGYIYDFAQGNYATFGIGGCGIISFLPGALQTLYGKNPLAYVLFIRAKLGAAHAVHEQTTEGKTIPVPAPVPGAMTTPTPSVAETAVAPLPTMTEDQLAQFLGACRPGVQLRVALKDHKNFTGIFSSYDSVNDTVWFVNPPGSFFKTKSYRLQAITSAQLAQP